MSQHIYEALIGFVWIIFWIYWLVSAIATGRKAGRPQTKGYFRYFIWIRIAIFLAAIAIIRLSHASGTKFNYPALVVHNGYADVVGVVIFGLGLALAIWARLNLGHNWGMPMSRKDKPEMVTSGPYKYVRHPIYSGILAALLGTALVVNLYWLLIMLLAGIYFVFSAAEEEKYLQTVFPDSYRSYMKQTKMLVPFLL